MTDDSPQRPGPGEKETKMDGTFQQNDLQSTEASAPTSAQSAAMARAPVETIPAYDVRRIMGSGNTAHMVLDGQAYTLRITRSGKLILTK